MARKLDQRSAADFIPPLPSDEKKALAVLHEAVEECRGCDLYKDATHGVFGEGPVNARIMFIGEVPGDKEDLAGHPFVGPAGAILDKALAEVGIERRQVYVTNAVKHFKWEPRGKKRLHLKPSAREIKACRPWLQTELDLVTPKVIVCLGATAAQAIMGPDFRLTQQRGRVFDTPYGARLLATLHPSAILRMPDDRARGQAYRDLVDDLKIAADERAA
jgi:uracil-DNA glycosylase family protein